MITTLVYTNNAGAILTLNDTVKFPTREFDTKIEFSDQTQEKMQADGEWPTFNYPRRRIFDISGDIMGTSTSNYITNRIEMMSKITPPPGLKTARRHGILTFQLDGMTETVFAYVQLSSYNCPFGVDEGYSHSPYQIIWKAWDPYLYGSGTGAVYHI